MTAGPSVVVSLRAFLGLVVRPLKGFWNLIGVGLPGAAVLVLWSVRNGVWAAIIGLSASVVLFGWAGFRLQREILQTEARQDVLGMLGRQLTIGRLLFSSIERAEKEFRANIDEAQREPDKAKRLGMLKGIITHPKDVTEWQLGVAERLADAFGYQFRAMFENDAGLTPGSPPEIMDDFYARQWRYHDLRLQRLHQIIQRKSESG
jgi:hypothetical protein